MLPTVGWIGLGNIGLPMARRVAAAGFPLHVWARRPQVAAPLVAEGASLEEDPESLARRCDIVATIVGGPDDVLELYRRMLPLARPATIFVEMTTASPDSAQECAALAARVGAAVLDAPVTGGVAGAGRGTLTSFVGGDAATFERARALLAAFSQRIVHCGAAGSGYRMKLVNQTIVAGVLLGLAEAAALARVSGFEAPVVVDALSAGTASGFLFDAYLPRMVEPGGPVTFTLGMLRKDLRLARAEAAKRSGTTRMLDFAIGEVDAACARFGEQAGVQFLAVAEQRGPA
ncbi:MAG: NAD(P)-dependent oxidoreductase [Burkholderiales bacterium]|nr:NAD(P)-dependent oxidoreductase [Burkholderiales bacterium]